MRDTIITALETAFFLAVTIAPFAGLLYFLSNIATLH